MGRFRGVDELLNNPKIASLAKIVERREAVDVFRVALPEKEVVLRQARQWAESIFSERASRDPRAEIVDRKSRTVYKHPDGFRVRAYPGSNTIEFRDTNRVYAGHTGIRESDGVRGIVDSFVARHKLIPDGETDLQFDSLRFVKSRGMSADREMSGIVVHNAIAVYSRWTDGLPWIGRGSRVVAMISGEEVVDYQRPWREVLPEPVSKVRLRPVAHALEGMLNDLSTRSGQQDVSGEDIELVQADLGFYAAGKHKTQRLIQPVYLFAYRLREAFSTNGFVFGFYAHEENLEHILPSIAAPRAGRRQRIMRFEQQRS